MATIYTIGYGNRKIETFLDLLKTYKIELLVDVRSKPFSRFNPAYRRKELEKHLQSVGIDYLFKGEELGGRPDNSNLYENGRISYEKVRNTLSYQEAIKELVKLAAQGKIVCVMCSELDQNHCHRKALLSVDFIKAEASVFHIDHKGKLVDHHSLPSQNKLF